MIELKHLACYLPYNLRLVRLNRDDEQRFIHMNNGNIMYAIENSDRCKPILRPMSDLKKDEWSPYVKLWDLSYLEDIGWGTDLHIDGPTSFWGLTGNYSMF